jgi:formylmethanofuran dehydrogenase subunit D
MASNAWLNLRRCAAFEFYMRVIGYILLIFGFVWLAVWCAGSVEPLTRSIATEHFKHYPGFVKYSGDEVCDAIQSVLTEYREDAYGVTLPAALMLVGGILLDIAGRRAARRITTETVSLEGPVELVNGKLIIRIPLAAGGDKLSPFAGGIGKIDSEYLNVTIEQRLAKKLKIDAGSLVSVDNRNGKFTITRSAKND